MSRKNGFALRDAIFAVAAVGALGAISLPVLSQVRMDSGRQRCINNYRFLGQATEVFAGDSGGDMWALSWKAGEPIPLQPGRYFASDQEAQAHQAVLTMRQISGMTAQELPVPQNWVASILYSHMPLLDYVGGSAFMSGFVCPEDSTRQSFLDGDYRKIPASGDGGGTTARWIFSSSYVPNVSHWAPSRQVLGTRPSGGSAYVPMPYPTSSDISFWSFDGDTSIPNSYRPRQTSEVAFPSQKVFLSDDYARHNGTQRFYAYQTAGQDMLFYDGSVQYFRPDYTNPGWDPTSSARRGSMGAKFIFTKKADVFGYLGTTASSATFTGGWHRWTRGGLMGWDVPRAANRIGKPAQTNVVENELPTNVGRW